MTKPAATLPLTPAQQALSLTCLGRAYQLALKHASGTRRPLEDCQSDAMLGLVESARRYDPAFLCNGKPVLFITYASSYISYYLLDGLTEWRKRTPERTAVTLTPYSDGWSGYGDGLPVPELAWPEHGKEEGPDPEIVRKVRACLARLPERERRFVERRLMAQDEDRLTLSELAEEFGCCKERARQIGQLGLAHLATYLRHRGITSAAGV